MKLKRVFLSSDKSVQPLEVIYFQFPGLSYYEWLSHGVFTRHGGMSQSPYNTLNTSYATGDNPESVKANLQIINRAMGARRLRYMKQIHGGDILIQQHDDSYDQMGPPNGDAMITDGANLALMVKQADCQAVILLDPLTRVVAIVHCGWRGNRNNILGSVVKRMRSEFGCRESEIRAAIGPSLGPCCAEFRSYEQIFPSEFTGFMVRKNYF
ncbi:MAG: polyphenol oxidase family protein, partial [Pseudomonadota bacterium]